MYHYGQIGLFDIEPYGQIGQFDNLPMKILTTSNIY